MRTTVRLDEDLLARLKQYAAQRNRTMASVLEDAVRQLLDRQESAPQPPTLDLITFGGDGLRVGVDLSPHGIKEFLAREDEEKFLGLQDASA